MNENIDPCRLTIGGTFLDGHMHLAKDRRDASELSLTLLTKDDLAGAALHRLRRGAQVRMTIEEGEPWSLMDAFLLEFPRLGTTDTKADLHIWATRLNQWWQKHAPPIFLNLRVAVAPTDDPHHVRWVWTDELGRELSSIDQRAISSAISGLPSPYQL